MPPLIIKGERTSLRDLERVLEDLGTILERKKIGWYVGTDRVEFLLDKPRPSLGPKRKFPFQLVMPYRVGEKKECYIVTPARTAWFGRRAAAYIGDPTQGSPWRLIREMSREAVEELTELFVHTRPGLGECDVHIGDVTTALYDKPQPSVSGPRLNGFRVLGELSLSPPLTGYAAVAQYGLAQGLYAYVRDEVTAKGAAAPNDCETRPTKINS